MEDPAPPIPRQSGGRRHPASSPFPPPQLGTTEVWQINNGGMMGGMDHSIHVHGVMFQIININGSAPPATHVGWKDTVNVPAGGSARIIMKFTDSTGKYMLHCHNLEHEDGGMMARFDVVPRDARASGNPGRGRTFSPPAVFLQIRFFVGRSGERQDREIACAFFAGTL